MQRQLQHGFTLVEMIVSVGLLGALAALGGWMFANGFTLVRSVNTDSALAAEVSVVADRLARELREIKLSSSGSYCITSTLPAVNATTGATTITFNKATADGAASCGTNDMSVTFARVSGSGPTELRMTYSASPAVTNAVMTAFSTQFEMRFKNASYVDTIDLAQVRFIEVALTMRPSGGRSAATRILVGLRNQ